MSWIATVIWKWLCTLTRIHKTHPWLWFYEEVKHCRKLNNTACLTDWVYAVFKKKKIELQSQNCLIFSSKGNESNLKCNFNCCDAKGWRSKPYLLYFTELIMWIRIMDQMTRPQCSILVDTSCMCFISFCLKILFCIWRHLLDNVS